MNEHLYRSRDDRMLAGVAGGLAEIWDADPSLIRIVWALLVVLTGGIALLVYIIMAIVVPEGSAAEVGDATAAPPDPAAPVSAASGDPSAADRRRAARAARRAARREQGSPVGLVSGAILIIVGVGFFLREWWPAFDMGFVWPLALVALGVVVLVVGLGRGSDRGGTAT